MKPLENHNNTLREAINGIAECNIKMTLLITLMREGSKGRTNVPDFPQMKITR